MAYQTFYKQLLRYIQISLAHPIYRLGRLAACKQHKLARAWLFIYTYMCTHWFLLYIEGYVYLPWLTGPLYIYAWQNCVHYMSTYYLIYIDDDDDVNVIDDGRGIITYKWINLDSQTSSLMATPSDTKRSLRSSYWRAGP